VTTLAQLGLTPLGGEVLRIVLAAALGMFLGLEREWSQKSAGIRTFALVSLLGAVFTLVGSEILLVIGGLLVITQGVLLAAEGFRDPEEGLSLTTSVSMLVAYGVGALVMREYVLEGVTVAIISSLLLVLKRELHTFAWGLEREELRSASEFAILAFVVYPLLPPEPVTVSVADLTLELELRVAWLLVVTVAGIGIVNYAVVQSYGGRGIAVTGFFDGLASSTAVVGTMLDHVRQRPEAASYAIAAILLADAAMALRNLVIAIAFTFERGILFQAIVPLGAVVLGSLTVAAYSADWRESVEMDLESPFSLRNALGFGVIFLIVLVASALGKAQFGTGGLYLTALLSGLASSGAATTSAVLLYRGGVVGGNAASIAILLATASSIVVKAALTLASPNRRFATRVALWSGVLLTGASAVTVLATM
jgi:uncharacterized membrane protein (DUF4010 family)